MIFTCVFAYLYATELETSSFSANVYGMFTEKFRSRILQNSSNKLEKRRSNERYVISCTGNQNKTHANDIMLCELRS